MSEETFPSNSFLEAFNEIFLKGPRGFFFLVGIGLCLFLAILKKIFVRVA